jgi:hypothetical protein
MHHLLGRTAAAIVLAGTLCLPLVITAQAQDDAVVATVNGMDLTEADIALAESELDPQFERLSPEQRRAAALSALIEIKLAMVTGHVTRSRWAKASWAAPMRYTWASSCGAHFSATVPSGWSVKP